MTGTLGDVVFFVCTRTGIVLDQPGDYVAGSLMHDGLERTFQYYVPTSYDGSEPVPLFISFHGGSLNSLIHIWFTRFDRVAEEEGFIVVFPNGTGSGVRYSFMRDGVDDVGFTGALIDDLEQKLNIDYRRIYASGYSNGGGLSTLLAFELSDRIAAIAPISSLTSRSVLTEQLLQGKTLSRPITMVISAGTGDQAYIDYPAETTAFDRWGEDLLSVYDLIEFFVQANDAGPDPSVTGTWPATEDDPTAVTRYDYAGGANDTEVVFYKIEEGGHAWPGGARLPGQGLTSTHISMSGLIWEHLIKHQLPAE